jgi:hypothetical protein
LLAPGITTVSHAAKQGRRPSPSAASVRWTSAWRNRISLSRGPYKPALLISLRSQRLRISPHPGAHAAGRCMRPYAFHRAYHAATRRRFCCKRCKNETSHWFYNAKQSGLNCFHRTLIWRRQHHSGLKACVSREPGGTGENRSTRFVLALDRLIGVRISQRMTCDTRIG